MNSKSSNKGSYLAFIFLVFLLSAFSSFAGPLYNYDHMVLAFKPSPSTASQSSMPRPTALITNIAVGTDPDHLTYENSTYGIKMQYPSSWYKHLGGYTYELANGTRYDLVSFSPLVVNQTAAINSLRLHFHLTPLSESLLKKAYPAGIPDFNASLHVSIYYPEDKGKTLSQYASDEYGFGKMLGLTTNNTLGGLPAYKSTYASTISFASLYPERSMHIGAIKGDKVFILTYEARPNEYDKYMPIVQQMINTFQITSSQPSR
ncbi:MAG: hypothetical protein WAM14_00355 [Candidatus Nitrosopolaris sp.]